MTLKENKQENGTYFNLPNEDRLEVDLEKKEKAEKENVANEVIKKVREKHGKKK
ncbi:hypothetical protein ACFSKI_01100 [Pseudogracilibacillus auburnensis]|uniref:Uncharacterized protein n=1 Tax=Pseudogracilibacillus auburnensis TaxID=1494959 RepID=A0A2V3VLE5_9BACI|nr:hypothetical protein [Pseudogracilibacillus auburnensis]MBO1002531.1 hypothetical protein [Pseudogracilibacillus auburnensis]PXW82627.1 hypothetical protein DFR56_11765 [Pseudogracilibacillus auburnensis]